MAFGQSPGKIITFNRADTEHCKVISAGGKPLLQSTYEGTTVAIALPLNSPWCKSGYMSSKKSEV